MAGFKKTFLFFLFCTAVFFNCAKEEQLKNEAVKPLPEPAAAEMKVAIVICDT